jgi:GxxExxY protein
MEEDVITQDILGCGIGIHRKYGSGMLESVYKNCLAVDLVEKGYEVAVEEPVPLVYKGLHLPRAFVLDLFVNRKVIVEVKCVSQILEIHVAQLSTYLRLTGAKVGLILNFKTLALKDGIRRVVNNYGERKDS